MRHAVLALLLTGCSYDWAVSGASPADAGHDAVLADAVVGDASDAQPTDGATSSDASDAGPIDSGNEDQDAGPDCAQLVQKVANAFDVAKTCTSCTTTTCMTSVSDQCGCMVVVCYDGMNQNTVDYVAAVNELKGSGCLAQYTCGDTCTPTTAACSFRPDAGTYGCYY